MVSLVGLSLATIAYFGFSLSAKQHTKIPSSPITIGIVNLSVIRNEGLAFKSFKELIEKQYKLFHSQILEQETEVRKNHDEIKHLENSSKKISEELEKRKKEIDNKVLILEKTIQEKKEKLNKDFTTIKNEIENTIQDIIDEVAKKLELNLVFNATIMDAPIILFGGKELDITQEILEELDKRLPAVNIDPVTVSE